MFESEQEKYHRLQADICERAAKICEAEGKSLAKQYCIWNAAAHRSILDLIRNGGTLSVSDVVDKMIEGKKKIRWWWPF